MQQSGNSENITENTGVETEDEINLLDLWRVIWNGKLLIISLVVATFFGVAVISLFLTDIYKSEAIIMPISERDMGGGISSFVQQFGGLSGMALPGASNSTEILSLLKSKILKEKVMKRYNLLPILFHEQWDEKKKDWKVEEKPSFSLNPLDLLRKTTVKFKDPGPVPSGSPGMEEGIPTIWDGLRMLSSIMTANVNSKDNTITLSVEFYDPVMAAKMVEYFLTTLIDHMTGEAKNVAETNRKYLEEQLARTADPLIRQKVYQLIAQQIEAVMMSEVKENFAFKVIDPQRVPDKKAKPKRALIVIISFFVSLFVAIFIVFFREFVKNARSMKDSA